MKKFEAIRGPPTLRPPTAELNLALRSSAGLELSYLDSSNESKNTKDKSKKSKNQMKLETRMDGSLDLSPIQQNSKVVIGGRFQVEKLLGEGNFAQTLLAVDLYSPIKTQVAIKVMNANYNIIGAEEYKRLVELNIDDQDGSLNIVKIITTFSYNSNHFCLVFERLYPRKFFVHIPPSNIHCNPCHLQKFMPANAATAEERRIREKSAIEKVKKMSIQVILALMLLRDHHLIHADLKPENLLFTDESSWRLKLIDFGNAFTIDQAHVYFETFEVQTLHYRAPEVLIGMPFDYSIDMWSLGMLLCEAWLGRPLVRANDPQKMTVLLLEYLGPLPNSPFNQGKFYNEVYSKAQTRDSYNLNLQDKHHLLKYRLRKLSEVLGTRDLHFLYFLNGLLEYDPRRRLTPVGALSHPFLASLFPYQRVQDYAQKEEEIMKLLKQVPKTPLPLMSPRPILFRTTDELQGKSSNEGDLKSVDVEHDEKKEQRHKRLKRKV